MLLKDKWPSILDESSSPYRGQIGKNKFTYLVKILHKYFYNCYILKKS